MLQAVPFPLPLSLSLCARARTHIHIHQHLLLHAEMLVAAEEDRLRALKKKKVYASSDSSGSPSQS